jgi:hypothetical protein
MIMLGFIIALVVGFVLVRRGHATSVMIVFGFVLMAVGSYVFTMLASNYAVCQRWDVNPNQLACQRAISLHSWGQVIIVTGILLFIGGLIHDRAHRRDGAERASTGPGRPEDQGSGSAEGPGHRS